MKKIFKAALRVNRKCIKKKLTKSEATRLKKVARTCLRCSALGSAQKFTLNSMNARRRRFCAREAI